MTLGPAARVAATATVIVAAIARSTGGRWHIGDSPLGGALMMVTWKQNSTPYRPPRRG